MPHAEPSPGFFGKVTTHGDFVSRRLPPSFLSVWDSWLQYGLQQSKEQLGPEWLGTYLSSPIWRFVLAPNVCGAGGWAGVLMPSVDRVGRHFPLTIAASLPDGCALADWIGQSRHWFDDVEEMALSSLDPGFSLQQFDLHLAGMPVVQPDLRPFAETTLRQPPGAVPYSRQPQGTCMPIADVTQAGVAVAAFQADAGLPTLDRHSLWWTDGSPRVDPCFLASPDLPLHASFAAMLDGEWTQRGWRLAVTGA